MDRASGSSERLPADSNEKAPRVAVLVEHNYLPVVIRRNVRSRNVGARAKRFVRPWRSALADCVRASSGQISVEADD